jgi:hypothetical protein
VTVFCNAAFPFVAETRKTHVDRAPGKIMTAACQMRCGFMTLARNRLSQKRDRQAKLRLTSFEM